jgi:thiol-disulfide isomerase/thioredoxin
MASAARALAAAASAAAILLLAGCDGGAIAAATPQSDGQSFVSGSYATTIYRVGDRPAAPTVTGVTLGGKRLSLADYHGSVVVMNFWGSWCAPCRAEAPALGTLARDFHSKGVRFIGVDIQDQRAAALAFMRTFRIGYPSLNDPSDSVALEFRSTVPPAAIPTTLVIDRTGHVAARIEGGVSFRSLRALILQVLGQR